MKKRGKAAPHIVRSKKNLLLNVTVYQELGIDNRRPHPTFIPYPPEKLPNRTILAYKRIISEGGFDRVRIPSHSKSKKRITGKPLTRALTSN